MFGERYYVLPTSEGYQQRGLASWYGRDFHGKPTSGGEPYDMHAMTAAHKTLPIPTWVEVRNLTNGKRVIVRVNDRGPFVDDRIIDMSYRAAQELEMVRDGTALVEVRALGAPTANLLAANGSRPDTAVSAVSGASGDVRPERAERSFSIISEAAADTPRANDRPLRQMFVQVGAFSEHGNAERLVERLRQNGFDDTFVHSAPGQGGLLHRVRIGPLADADQYDRVNRGLRSIGVNDGRLVVDN